MTSRLINPTSLGAPKGYSHGVLADANGKLLFIAGQIGWDGEQKLVGNSFIDQFDQALANVLSVVFEAGGQASDICRLVIYVADKNEYRSHTREVGERYRKHLGRHFPAMVLVEVAGLVEDGAKVEIEGTAVISTP